MEFKVGDRVEHHYYGKGTVLGNHHKRGGYWYWHIGYDDGTFGYNTEHTLTSIGERE